MGINNTFEVSIIYLVWFWNDCGMWDVGCGLNITMVIMLGFIYVSTSSNIFSHSFVICMFSYFFISSSCYNS